MSIETRIERLETLLRSEAIKFRLYNGVPVEISNNDLKRVLSKVTKGEDLKDDMSARFILDADPDSFDPQDGSLIEMLCMFIKSKESIDPERAKLIGILSEIIQ